MIACHNGRVGVVMELIEADANLNARNTVGYHRISYYPV